MLSTWLALVSAGYGQELSLQTGVEARVVEEKSTEGRTLWSSHLEPDFQLSWQGPLRSDLKVYAGFHSSGSTVSEPQLFTSQQSTELDLRAQGEALSLGATVNWNTDRFSVVNAGGAAEVDSSRSTTVSLDAELAYPAYPQLSLQYQRGTNYFSGAAPVVSTSILLGANYDWGPFRVWGNGTQQSSDTAGASVRSLQYGVDFTAALVPAVQLSVDHSYWTSGWGGASTGAASRTTTVRVTALPTPFLVMDGEMDVTSSAPQGQAGGQAATNVTQTLNLRSDPLPGMRLDVRESGQQTSTGGFSVSSQAWTGNFAWQILGATTFEAIVSQAHTRDSTGLSNSHQGQQQFSLTTPLSTQLDLQASYTGLTQSLASSRFSSSSAVLGVSGELAQAVIATASVRHDVQDSAFDGGGTSNRALSLQATAQWSPDEAWSLTLGAEATRSGGTRQGTLLSPAAEVRWNPDLVTTLTARYDLQRTTDTSLAPGAPPVTFAGTSSTFTGSLTRELGNQETIQLSYDSQDNFAGLFAWQRTLELQWSKTF